MNEDKVREAMLRWYSHVRRIHENAPSPDDITRTCSQHRRSRGRQRLRWRDAVQKNMRDLHLEDEAVSGSRH